MNTNWYHGRLVLSTDFGSGHDFVDSGDAVLRHGFYRSGWTFTFVSDTLYGIFPFFVCTSLMLDWIGSRTSGGSIQFWN